MFGERGYARKVHCRAKESPRVEKYGLKESYKDKKGVFFGMTKWEKRVVIETHDTTDGEKSRGWPLRKESKAGEKKGKQRSQGYPVTGNKRCVSLQV